MLTKCLRSFLLIFRFDDFDICLRMGIEQRKMKISRHYENLLRLGKTPFHINRRFLIKKQSYLEFEITLPQMILVVSSQTISRIIIQRILSKNFLTHLLKLNESNFWPLTRMVLKEQELYVRI
jgi:hypothetical protein